MRTRRTVLFVAAVTAAVGASTAYATFPGGVGRIVFPMGGGNVELYSARPDGTDSQQLTTAPGFNGCPSYSRDGAQIAFCSNRTGTYRIWLMKADGSDQRQLATGPYEALFPRFQRDGRSVFFNADTRSPAGEDIYVGAVSGGKATRLTGAPGDDEYPAVSPDGKTIAFVSHRIQGKGQVWLMDSRDGKHQRALTHGAPAKDELPDWSPDGKQIVYQAGADIWLMNADGSAQRNLTRGRFGLPFGPVWSPDGTKIAFVGRAGLTKQVYVMNADGTGAHPLLAAKAKQLMPAWQPSSP